MPPADYILVLEDTDGDGRADKSWRFAEGLTMVQGVEPADGGVSLSASRAFLPSASLGIDLPPPRV